MLLQANKERFPQPSVIRCRRRGSYRYAGWPHSMWRCGPAMPRFLASVRHHSARDYTCRTPERDPAWQFHESVRWSIHVRVSPAPTSSRTSKRKHIKDTIKARQFTLDTRVSLTLHQLMSTAQSLGWHGTQERRSARLQEGSDFRKGKSDGEVPRPRCTYSVQAGSGVPVISPLLGSFTSSLLP